MAKLAAALGPDRVCCLTGVAKSGGAADDLSRLRVYRRPAAFAKSKYLKAVPLVTTLIQIMVREKPQVVQLSFAGEGYLGLWLRRCFKLPFVIYAHGNEILTGMQWNPERYRIALQQAYRVLANSKFTAKLVKKAGVDPDRIEIVYPGCDVNFFRPLQPKENLRRKLLGNRYRNRVILTVGNLVARKGHDMVIRAIPKLRESVPDVTYLIIGDGPYRIHLEKIAMDIGVQDCIIFAGQVPDESLPDIYALSEVFVMPSREELGKCDVEGFGLVFLEANACAKPVVGGRSGGIPEAIVDGVTGLLVNPHDPEDIANALKRLLIDRNFAIRLGQQGRDRAARDFNWAVIVDRVQGIIYSSL